MPFTRVPIERMDDRHDTWRNPSRMPATALPLYLITCQIFPPFFFYLLSASSPQEKETERVALKKSNPYSTA
jgi:hypothetical protein